MRTWSQRHARWTKPWEQQTTADLWAGVVGVSIWLAMPALFIVMTFWAEATGASWGMWLVRGAIALVYGLIWFAWTYPRFRELRRRRDVGLRRDVDDEPP